MDFGPGETSSRRGTARPTEVVGNILAAAERESSAAQ